MKKQIKCSDCQFTYTDESIEPNKTSLEAECPKCGTYNYVKLKKMKDLKKPISFKKGEKVKIQYIFSGAVKETSTKTIHSISKNTIYLKGSEGEKETGAYYNLDGTEKDCAFYPQIYSKITKL